jgi:hypothetical protein
MPEAGPEELRLILREWHRLVLPLIQTKDFDESWTDFTRQWQSVRWPSGASFRAAEARAQRHEPAVAERYDGNLRRLVNLCFNLQLQWGARPFPLSCEKAGDHLGVSKMQASRYFKALQFDRLLERISKGSKRTGKASEWRFTDLVQSGNDP